MSDNEDIHEESTHHYTPTVVIDTDDEQEGSEDQYPGINGVEVFSTIIESNGPTEINDNISSNQDTTVIERQMETDSEQGNVEQVPKEASPVRLHVKLIDLLPDKVAEVILHSPDELFSELTTTVEKKLLYTNEVAVNDLDLTLPKAYGNKLQNNKKLLENILVQVLQKISSVEQLHLPTLPIDVHNSFLKILKDQKCHKIIMPFTAQDENTINSMLPTITEALINQEIKIIDYRPTEKHVDIKAKNCQLKKELKKLIKEKEDIVVIYDGSVISGKRKKSTSAKPGVKRSSDSKLSSSAKKPKLTHKKQSSASQKVQLLPKYPTINKEMFSFDSGGPLQNVSDFSFTPYSYWQLDKIHQISTGRGITLAVVDSGIEASHPAFGNIFEFQDFTGDIFKTESCDHGTLCAGIACGKSFKYYLYPNKEEKDRDDFPPGVAPNTNLVICKALGDNTNNINAIVKALQWLRGKNVDVVSFSLGTLNFNADIAQAITELIVYDKVIIVCAASNEGHRYSQPICFPARLGHVLCIGSHGPHGKPSAFSPVGQDIDFLAPGEGVAGPSSSIYNHHVRVDSGTSYAAPAVAGLICLVFELIQKTCPNEFHLFKNPWVVKELLREMSTSPGNHSSDRGYGGLNPLSFFKQPSGVLQKIWSEVILPSI